MNLGICTDNHLFNGKTLELLFPDVAINENYYFLMFSTPGSPTYNIHGDNKDKIENKIPFSEKITFTLKCPYPFGNNSAHEIVTWWKPYNMFRGGTICYHIEFEGKIITEFQYDTEINCFSIATIVLENR